MELANEDASIEARIKMNKNYYSTLDIMKLFFSICVVCLHVHVAENNFYLWNMIFNLGVPFFFVSSGYLYAKRNDSINWKNCIVYIKRMLIPFLFWHTVYTIIVMAQLSDYYSKNPKNIIINYIQWTLFYPSGANWYLLASFIGMFLVTFCYQKLGLKVGDFLAIACYFVLLIGNSYYYLVIDYHPLSYAIQIYRKIFISTRNGLFVGFPMILLGVLIGKSQMEKAKTLVLLFLWVGSTVLCALEVRALYPKMHSIFDNSFLLTYLLCAPMLVLLCVKVNFFADINTRLLRKLSTSIFMTHHLFIYLFKGVIYNTTLLLVFVIISCIFFYFAFRNTKVFKMVVC